MTLSKLSLRNARRQAGDYLVYFATIIMVTALMYSLNGLIFSEEIQSLSKLLKSLPFIFVKISNRFFDALESSAPVGSSASSNDCPPTMARAQAAR